MTLASPLPLLLANWLVSEPQERPVLPSSLSIHCPLCAGMHTGRPSLIASYFDYLPQCFHKVCNQAAIGLDSQTSVVCGQTSAIKVHQYKFLPSGTELPLTHFMRISSTDDKSNTIIIRIHTNLKQNWIAKYYDDIWNIWTSCSKISTNKLWFGLVVLEITHNISINVTFFCSSWCVVSKAQRAITHQVCVWMKDKGANHRCRFNERKLWLASLIWRVDIL